MATAPTTTQPTARKRPSRASRSAAEQQPQPEPGQPKLAVVPNPSETPKQATTPALKVKPSASVDLGAKPVTYWFPSAKLSDGTTVTCPHARYGHESEASAKRCIAQLVAQNGHRVS